MEVWGVEVCMMCVCDLCSVCLYERERERERERVEGGIKMDTMITILANYSSDQSHFS